MKKILSFLVLMFMCLIANAADMYNTIATAYVTTTISQKVVFDSTMQQGGTFTFSVLAHNGGGRPGQSDTANVKIQFYTASNSLVSTVNSSYSNNLPNPNGTPGNPWTDPAVPWTNLTTSSTNCGGSCANVAYATISMYGIDGSYWAGDYGPWYRAPTFTLNGGSNMAYNPEFGPYNGITAQGWTSSPGFGACQGAWGGSNACIVNSSGQPGTSTTGLVANQNGGGPSATGGTTNGQAGGYNNAMTTSSPTGPPPAPTVTSTTTTNQTKTVIVNNQQQTITTPVTTTTYSDGTTKTTNGTSTTNTISNTAFTGVHFGAAQVADTQWDVGACTQTSTCNIYSTSPGGTYNTGSWTAIASNQYITFIPNTASDSATNPWRMILVNSDGTFTDLGSCHILVQGTDSNGNIFMFVSPDDWTGTLFSGNLGLTGQGVTFTGTANPTMSDTNNLSGNMSSSPLAAGQTGGTPMVTALTPTGPIQNVDGGSTTVGLWAGSVGLSNWDGNMVSHIGPNWTWSCDNCTGSQTGTVINASIGSVGNPNDWMSITLNVPSESGKTYNFYPPGYVPTATSTSTSNQTTTSSSIGSTDTTSNTYTWGGGTYTVIGSATPTTTTTSTTPVTTTTWSNGTTTTSNGTTTTTNDTTWDYNVTGPQTAPVNPNAGTNRNSVYITQTNAGASNSITTDQSGHGNYESVSLGGSNNIVRLGQGYTFSNIGIATESANASNYNLSAVTVSGNFNGVVNSQVGTSNSAIVSSTGNYNSLLATQTGNNNQVYGTISGNNNSLSFGQTGSGNIAAANLYGNNNVATVTQTGNNHSTVLNLINAGGANNVSVIQTGTGDAYSLQQTCTNPAGCSVTVIRNK
jgi:hypothetical protein